MEKFKKVAKIVGVIAIIVLALFVGVCVYAFPTETQEYFRNAMTFLNQPLPIVGVSLLVIGGFVLKAISMTSFGKKALEDLKAEHNKWKKEVDETESKELELKAEVDETKREVEDTLDRFAKDTDELIKVFYEALKTSPNKKVQAFADKLVELYPLVFEKEKEETKDKVLNLNSFQPKEITNAKNMGLGDDIDKESVQNG